jgi:hypothetical protein
MINNIEEVKQAYKEDRELAARILRKSLISFLIDNKFSYDFIGQLFSVSRQRIEQIIHNKN